MRQVGTLLAACLLWAGTGQAEEPAAAEKPPPMPMKDVPKAMKQYFLVFVVSGPKFEPGDTETHRALMPKHLAHIRKLIEAKKMRLAGPTMDEGRILGIGIVAAPTLEQARAWMDEDPAVQAGFFAHEFHPVMLPSLEGLKVRY
jgi:uncharacterized protein YciI